MKLFLVTFFLLFSVKQSYGQTIKEQVFDDILSAINLSNSFCCCDTVFVQRKKTKIEYTYSTVLSYFFEEPSEINMRVISQDLYKQMIEDRYQDEFKAKYNRKMKNKKLNRTCHVFYINYDIYEIDEGLIDIYAYVHIGIAIDKK